jgi:predicted Zn-dependent protease
MREPLAKRAQSRVAPKRVARPALAKSSRRSAQKKATTRAPVRVSTAKPAKKTAAVKTTASVRKKSPVKAARLTKTTATKKPAVKAKSVKVSPRVAKAPLKALRKGKGKTLARTKGRVAPRRSVKVLQRVIPPPPPEPPRRQPATGVIKAFEQAVRVFNRRQYSEAKDLFESVQQRYPQEVEINARAQTYIQVCNQKMARPLSSPRDADELYDRGVVALNTGDFTQARTMFEKALRMRPDEPHLLYSLAATHAQTGTHDEALDYLVRSIQIQPRYRSQAMNDADFTELHNDKRFLEILGVKSPFDLFDPSH